MILIHHLKSPFWHFRQAYFPWAPPRCLPGVAVKPTVEPDFVARIRWRLSWILFPCNVGITMS